MYVVKSIGYIPLEHTIAISIGITLGACTIAIAGRTLFWRMFRAQCRSDTPLLDLMIERQSPLSGRRRFGINPPRNKSREQGEPTPQLAMLERHLRTAILDENARERLVNDAMRTNGGKRAAAIRKVLRDLCDEDKRWS